MRARELCEDEERERAAFSTLISISVKKGRGQLTADLQLSKKKVQSPNKSSVTAASCKDGEITVGER